jgi:hypothetical protein
MAWREAVLRFAASAVIVGMWTESGGAELTLVVTRVGRDPVALLTRPVRPA